MKLCKFVDLCLSTIGVDKIFGIPGALIMPVWQSITNKEVILCSHEQEASYVATGYAKSTRKPVCVITTGGPGVTNCLSGIASANIDSIPLIFISGKTPVGKQGLGLRQEESQFNRLYDSNVLLKDITKISVCISEIHSAAQIIWDTMKMAVDQRKGAVHISIPIDLQNKEIVIPTLNNCFENHTFVFMNKVPISERPLFMLGWGSWMADAYQAVYKLAERVNAPVLVSSKAYCCICRDNRMFLGKLGYGYHSGINEFINMYKPDSIVGFGSSFGEKDIKNTVVGELIEKVPTYLIADDCSFLNGKQSKIIPIETRNMKQFVIELIGCSPEFDINEKRAQQIQKVKRKSTVYWHSKILSSDLMAKCIEYVNEVICDTNVVFADAGNHLANTGALITPKYFGGMFLDVGLRAMGTGICTAVGMAIADKTKTYIAITGDGCMLMNGNVMHLTFEKKLPIVFVVFNNRSLGRVRVGQSLMDDYRGSDINHVDFVQYGRAFGLIANRCKSLSEFKKIFSQAIHKKAPYLIEIITQKNEIPVSIKGNIY